MRKLIKRIIHWFGNIRYFVSYSVDSIEQTMDRDQRALKLAIRYPITPEDARKLIDVADALGISDSTVDKLVHNSALMGFDRLSFPLDMMMLFRIEFRRKGLDV